MYILFTIQSLQRGISHRSCSQKGHLGRWVVGWGVVLRVDIGIDCWKHYHTCYQDTRGCAMVVQLTNFLAEPT